ncbi:super-infection exclusion protein B, partial [Xenorhabdus bovienii]|uniref:Superinfection exclusion protein B n=2 Tax=Xenorhabdus bovienii TaxID=40576 RepID=A0A0B6XDR7_XENBV
MNNTWWQDFVRFFLQGITLKQLIHMTIILVILIITTPASFKAWVNLHNPEIIPNYGMYYLLLFCLSYVINSAISATFNLVKARCALVKERFTKRKIEKEVRSLSDEEKDYLSMYLDVKMKRFRAQRNNITVEGLVEKGILINLGESTTIECDDYMINEDYYHPILRQLSGRLD